MPPIRVSFIGDDTQFAAATARNEAALARFATSAEEASKVAAKAAADQAAAAGKSADQQAAAAGRAAAAVAEASERTTAAQQAAARGAVAVAKAQGASADQQVAAARRAVAAQKELEGQQAAAADAAKAAADAQAAAARQVAAAQEAAAGKVELLTSKVTGLGGHATGVAKEVSKIGGIGFAASIAGMGDLAAKYQQTTQSIAANSDVSSAAAAKIGKAFLQTSGTTIYSAGELAGAYAKVAGQLKATEGQALTSAQATNVMNDAGDLAEATSSDLGDATSALSQVMQGYHLSVNQAADASDVLFNTSRALNQPLETVAQSMSKLHGRLGDLAPSLGDVGGLMVDLGSHGVQGSRGVSVVNTALETLVGHSKPVTDMLAALGVNIFNSQGKFVGLQNVIGQLQPKLAGLTQQQQDFAAKTLFGSGAAQVMLSTVQRGPQAFAQATGAAQKLGTSHQAAADQSKTLGKQLDILKASVEDDATSIGLKLIPELTSMANGLEDGIQWLERHKTAADALGIAIGVTLAGAVSVFAYQKSVAFVKGIGDMVGGVGHLASGLIGLGGEEEAAQTETEALTGAIAELTGALTGVESDATVATAEIAAVGDAAATAAPEVDALEASASGLLGTLGRVAAAAAPAAAATALLVGGDDAPMKTYAKHPPGFPQYSAPKKGESERTYLKGSLGLPPGYKGGSISASSYKGPGLDTKSIDSFFQWLNQVGEFGKNGFMPATVSSSAASVGAAAVSSSPAWRRKLSTAEGLGADPNVLKWSKDAQAAGAKYNVNPALLLADISQESGGVPVHSTGSTPGVGNLTQFLPSTAKEYGVKFGTTPADELSQIMGQAKLLASMGVQKNATAALEGYNSGTPGNSVSAGYAASVLSKMQQYSPLFTGKLGAIPASTPISTSAATAEQKKLEKLMQQVAGGGKQGAAATTSTIPVAVATMLSTAQALVGTNYSHAGDHGSTFDSVAELKKIGIDCSGFVSAVLHSGGVKMPLPQTTQGLPSYLQKGKGSAVTVYDRTTGATDNEHTLIDILGKWFMSGGNKSINPSSQVMQMTTAQAAKELAGGQFQAYHPTYSGKLATTKQLKALGVSNLSNASLSDTTAEQTSELQTEIQQIKQSATTAGQTMLKQLQAVSQSGKSLASGLGVNLTSALGQLGAKSSASKIGGVLGASAAGSEANSKYQQDVLALIETGQQKEADKLVAAHKEAMAQLVKEVQGSLRVGAASGVHGAGLLDITDPLSSTGKSITTAGQKMAQRYQADVQNGSVSTLGKAFGFDTSGRVLTGGAGRSYTNLGGTMSGGYGAFGTSTLAAALRSEVEGLGDRASAHQINRQLGGTVTQATSGSSAEKAYQQQVLNLVALGEKNQADKLVAAHKAAMRALGQEIYAEQKTMDGQLAENQATQLKDQTTKIQDLAQNWQEKAQAMQQAATDAASAVVTKMTDVDQITSDTAAAQVTAMKDQQQLTDDASAATVTGMKDMQQSIDDASAAMVQNMSDMQQTVDDQMAGMVQAVKDATTLSADVSQGIVDKINDNTQTQVDTIGEKGLYGLALIAQQDKVAYDQEKAYWDQQIDAAQQQLDVDQASADTAESAAQVNLDQLTTAQDQLVAQAQNNADTVQIAEDQQVATAQAALDAAQITSDANNAAAQLHLDQVQLSADTNTARAQAHADSIAVTGAARIMNAQSHADSVQLHVDTSKVGPAQIAVDLNATASKSVQDVMNGQLSSAQGSGDKLVADANKTLANVTGTVGQLTQTANDQLSNVQSQGSYNVGQANSTLISTQGTGSQLVQGAQGTYNNVSDTASQLIQGAQDGYSSAEDTANQAIQDAKDTLQNVTDYWNWVLANASGILQNLTNQGTQAEAQSSGTADVAGANASTQFAGSGLTVNVYGVPATNAAAIGTEASWAIRSLGVAA